jgi:hypothetical protein
MTKQIFKKGVYLGSVDREFENDYQQPVVKVVLPDGYIEHLRDFLQSDEWLIKRAIQLKNKK